MTFAATVHRDGRAAERHATVLDGTLRDCDRQPCDVIVHDLSADGLRLTASSTLPQGSTVTIGLPGLGVRSAVIVRAGDGDYGCRFIERLTADDLSRTLTAVVTAPIPITPATRDALLLDVATSPADLYSPRVRVVTIAAAVGAAWTLLLTARLLIG